MRSRTLATARLPKRPDLADVFRAYPLGVAELLAYHDALLRGDSPLSVGERELIAVFVSSLNACGFCFGAHRIIAERFGVQPDVVEHLLTDIDRAPIPARLKPIFKLLAKLTRAPASVEAADREAVFAAGWNERALHDAIAVCALFNFMNRLVEGMGVVTTPAIRAAQRARHARGALADSKTPYQDYSRLIGVLPRHG
ncbi:MAG: peroxidase-related enzyme [Sinobacteraceae bacterium]|nr:peroxidase-related enzyme [Nevskiaceae bacterium]